MSKKYYIKRILGKDNQIFSGYLQEGVRAINWIYYSPNSLRSDSNAATVSSEKEKKVS